VRVWDRVTMRVRVSMRMSMRMRMRAHCMHHLARTRGRIARLLLGLARGSERPVRLTQRILSALGRLGDHSISLETVLAYHPSARRKDPLVALVVVRESVWLSLRRDVT